MKPLSFFLAWVFVLCALTNITTVAVAEDTSDAIDTSEETVDPPAPTSELNATQTAKAERLAEASGVSQEEIIAMRLGITTATDDPETSDEGAETETENETDLPRGRGWGVIARWLGLHPSTLGNATGRTLSETDDTDTDQDSGLLASRSRARNTRLFAESAGGMGVDSADRSQRGRERGQLNRQRRTDRAQSRASERSNNRGGNGSGNNNRGGNGHGSGNNNRGGNGNGRGQNR